MVRPDLRRHDLVRVDPGAFAVGLRDRSMPDPGSAALDWIAAGRPLIVRRSGPGESDRHVPLGLPLPPAQGRRRIALAAAPDAVAALPAPDLADARGAAPAAWRPTLDALVGLGARHDFVPRPFGSLLWQALTGLDYLTATSDLDLLWPMVAPCDPRRLSVLLAGIATIAQRAPMRLDGEILMPDSGGIHWRELHAAPDGGEVLAKYRDRVALRPVERLRVGSGVGA